MYTCETSASTSSLVPSFAFKCFLKQSSSCWLHKSRAFTLTFIDLHDTHMVLKLRFFFFFLNKRSSDTALHIQWAKRVQEHARLFSPSLVRICIGSPHMANGAVNGKNLAQAYGCSLREMWKEAGLNLHVCSLANMPSACLHAESRSLMGGLCLWQWGLLLGCGWKPSCSASWHECREGEMKREPQGERPGVRGGGWE